MNMLWPNWGSSDFAKPQYRVSTENPGNYCLTTCHVNKQEVTLGRLADAVADARQSITHADHSGDASTRMANRTTVADAKHHSSRTRSRHAVH